MNNHSINQIIPSFSSSQILMGHHLTLRLSKFFFLFLEKINNLFKNFSSIQMISKIKYIEYQRKRQEKIISVFKLSKLLFRDKNGKKEKDIRFFDRISRHSKTIGNMTDFRLLFVICSAQNLKIQLTPLRTTTPKNLNATNQLLSNGRR
ncbi:hypothetical protein M0811_14304 [Anaeramoeba ignava]|uniref:Uncharacterized protein n=1 Tax=Anaeramoeba ignava TaxID=1746090 RepID=A0A9Q0RHB0_ANAIG|nr:hypothetical protein M0811_14304 [Anaeramoeba ignava]